MVIWREASSSLAGWTEGESGEQLSLSPRPSPGLLRRRSRALLGLAGDSCLQPWLAPRRGAPGRPRWRKNCGDERRHGWCATRRRAGAGAGAGAASAAGGRAERSCVPRQGLPAQRGRPVGRLRHGLRDPGQGLGADDPRAQREQRPRRARRAAREPAHPEPGRVHQAGREHHHLGHAPRRRRLRRSTASDAPPRPRAPRAAAARARNSANRPAFRRSRTRPRTRRRASP